MIRAIRILLYLVAALVVVVGLALAFLATSPGRAVVASLVERAVAGSGLSLSIGRLSGWPPFSFGADKVVIADAKGPFAEIDGLAVDISVWRPPQPDDRLRRAQRRACRRKPRAGAAGERDGGSSGRSCRSRRGDSPWLGSSSAKG